MADSYDLYVVHCNVRGHNQPLWTLFIAASNTKRGTFYFGDPKRAATGWLDAPPEILHNEQLPEDQIRFIECIETITLPHMEGSGGFTGIVTELCGRDNKSYLIEALFQLERAWLVPNGTWV
jgi:hypothetical protein